MSTAELYCIGRGHEARFAEDFDGSLAMALDATPDPARAAAELDDVALLTTLANFAGLGPYDPAAPPDDPPFLLEIDDTDAAQRTFRWHWWLGNRPVGRFAFTGRSVSVSQTVVFRARFEPVR